MSQYRTGTVAVTNASAAVVGTNTKWAGNVAAGHLFTISGSLVPYVVGSVTDDTHLTLSSNYAGATQGGLAYSITTSLTPNFGLPYMEDRDIDTATIFKRAMLILDTLMARHGKQGVALASANNLTPGTDGNYFQITGAVQINLLESTGLLGGEVFTFKFNGAPTVKHNQAPSGAFKPYKLAGAVDFVATASDTLTLRYDLTDACFYEISRAVI